MPFKKELCRNFQRGSCQYGERCKFVHAAQQQPKANAYGFGTQITSHQQQKPKEAFGSLQHQKPNPFGFGVQNNSQSKGANDYPSNKNQPKPFENKWSRFPSTSGGGAPSRNPDTQPQAANHKCTDPESCKRIIVEDFEHERPLWKLTCYGHLKSGPCDIVGDASYEELRLSAYEDSKRGMSLQSIVEKERNLLNSKLLEFDNFLRNPYRGPANSNLTSLSSVPENPPNVSYSSFSQHGAPFNAGFGVKQPGQLNNSIQNSSQISTVNGMNSFPSTNPGFGRSATTGAHSSPFFGSLVSAQKIVPSSNLPSISFNGPTLSSNAVVPTTSNVQCGNNLQRETASGSASIWLKQKWTPGEIPEEAPPNTFVQWE